jgi:hypothetical protein
MFVALQNSVPVGGMFLGGPHTLQNSTSGGGLFGAVRGKPLQRSGSDIWRRVLAHLLEMLLPQHFSFLT